MGQEAGNWEVLNQIFIKGELQSSLDVIAESIREASNLSELARATKTMAELHLNPSKDPELKKSTGYALLSAYCQIELGRFAPATAMLDWLRTYKAPRPAIEHLADLLSKTFSQNLADGKTGVKSHSADRPVRTTVPPKPKIPLFSGLTLSESRAVIEKTKTKILQPNEILFKEGDEASAFYIVAEGEMELSNSTGLHKILGEGEFFGEIAVLGNRKRTATLKAKSEVRLLEYSKSLLIDIFIHFPALEERLLKFYFWRVFLHVAAQHPFFKEYSEEALTHFFYLHEGRRAPPRTTLIQENLDAQRIYFLLDGTADVIQDGKVIAQLGAGQFMGEMGLLGKKTRSAQITTVSACDYLECPDYLFDSLCKQFPKLKPWLESQASERLISKVAISD
jgi:CRP-like cAMP-binding protein